MAPAASSRDRKTSAPERVRQLYRATINFRNTEAGEIVDVFADEWAEQIEAGWLVRCDDEVLLPDPSE